MQKYYDEEEERFEDGEQQQRQFLANERLTVVDWVLAAVLSLAVFVGITVFAVPGLSPLAWDSAAVAAGLRPPMDVFPGFSRAIAHMLFLGGVSSGTTLLRVLGHVCAALTAGSVYLFLRAMIAMLVRGRLMFAARRYLVQRVAAAVGAAVFACSDPAWRAGQAFSAESFLILLTVLAVTPFILFLLNGRLVSAYLSMFLLGALAAETPLGLILLAICWFAYHMAVRHDALGEQMPLLDPLTSQTAKWNLTFFWSVGITAGIGLNCWSFLHMGGAATLTGGLPLAYGMRWWTVFMETAGSLGWVLAFVFCVLPFIVAIIMLPLAVSEEQFLPYHVGGLFFIAALVSFSQLSFASPVWFWTWGPLTEVRSVYILQFFLLLAAVTVAFFLTVMGVDACCRNHERLASFRVAEDDSADATAGQGGSRRHGVIVLGVVSAVLLAGVLPGRPQPVARQMLGIVDDFADEVLKECGDARCLFTDGAIDARLELGAAARGRKLVTIPMTSGDSEYEKLLRMRAAEDDEDRAVLGMDASTALRSWMRDKPARFAKCATMFGMELWCRDGLEVPPCSGTLMRPGMSEADIDAGAKAARKLGDRIVAMYDAGGIDSSAGERTLKAFTLVQWRLSRLARERAARADRAGRLEIAKAEQSLADRLDDRNAALKTLVKAAERRKDATLRQVTPREGLQLALLRADFALAHRYAGMVLAADPDNPDANFGSGMYFFQQEQWTRAEEALSACLKRKPAEPAVLNNLALAQMKQGRFDEAAANAAKALKLVPNSAEVKDTLATIENEKQKVKNGNSKDRRTKKD